MSDQHGPEAEGQLPVKMGKEISDDQENQHQGDTGDDLCIQHGYVGDAHEKGTPAFFHIVHGHAGAEADEGGHESGEKGDDHRISKGQKDLFILEKFGVPAGGKTAPAGPALGLVEGEHHQCQDGRVQKHENKDQINIGADFFQCFHLE